MKKIITTISFCLIALLTSAQIDAGEIPFADGTTTILNRGPNGNVRYQIVGAHYTANELNLSYAPGYPFSSGIELTQLGFNYYNSGIAATANIKIYLENTTDANFAKTGTWSSNVSTMTKVYDGPITFEENDVVNASFLFSLITTPSAFKYTGGNLYMFFEYSNPSGTLTGTATEYKSTTGDQQLGSIKFNTSNTAMPTSLTTGSGQGAGNRRPTMNWGYRLDGKEIAIREVRLPSNPVQNTAYPIAVSLENLGNINASAYTVAINVDGVQIASNTGPQITKGSKVMFNVGTWTPTVADKFYKITTTLSLTQDKIQTNNKDTSTAYVFSSNAILKEDFDDTSKFKNYYTQTSINFVYDCAVGNNWIYTKNDANNNTFGQVGEDNKYAFVTPGTNYHLTDEKLQGQSIYSSEFYSDGNGKQDKWLISPLNSTYCSSNTDSLLFYLQGFDPQIDSVQVLLSPTGGTNFSDFTIKIADIIVPKTGNKVRYGYKLNTFLLTTTTNYRIALRHYHKNDNASNCGEVYIDDVSINRYNSSGLAANGAISINGLTVNFFGNTVGSGLTYQWDFTNDGTFDSNLQNPIYTYPSVGTYVAKLRVSTSCGYDDTLLVVNLTPAGINESSSNRVSFNMLPNPANDLVTVEVNDKNFTLYIINILGEVVYTETELTSKASVNLSELKAGTYIVRIVLSDGKTGTKRLVVTK